MKAIKFHQNPLYFLGIPAILITALVLLIKILPSLDNPSLIATAITIDLVLTIPFIYWFLIRKTKVPKTTILPMLLLGTGIATIALPKEHQATLSLFTTWILPFIELIAISYVLYKTRKAIIYVRKHLNGQADFFTALKQVSSEIAPKRISIFFATEIAIFYYGLFKWKKTKLLTDQFSYHKNGTTVSLLFGILLLTITETIGIHFLLAGNSVITAWVITGLSVYSGFMIIGFLKSMMHRPIELQEESLFLPFGIMGEALLQVRNIKGVELHSKDLEKEKMTQHLSPFGETDSHNLLIHLKAPIQFTSIYGFKKTCSSLVVFVDEPAIFSSEIEKRITALQYT